MFNKILACSKSELVLIVFFIVFKSYSQHLINVKDNINHEPISEAYILNFKNEIIGLTNSNGLFKLEKFVNRVSVFKEGYVQKSIELTSPNLTIYLTKLEESLDSVTINSKYNSQLKSTETGTIFFDKDEIEKMPTILGEKDIIKYISLTPGVLQSTEGQSSFFVRGGNSSMNLMLLDEMYLHNTNHLGGLYNSINSDFLESVKFYKSSFSAKYGNRLSSITSMKSVKRTEKLTGDFSLGLISSKATLNIPISKKSTILISGRRTYFDLIKNIFPSNDTKSFMYKNTSYHFYDRFLKYSLKINPKNTINLKYFNSKDEYSTFNKFDFEKRFNWKNAAMGFDIKSNFKTTLFNEFYFDKAKYTFDYLENKTPYKLNLSNFFDKTTIKNVSTYNFNSNILNIGFEYNNISNQPKYIDAKYNNSQIDINNTKDQKANFYSVFMGNKGEINKYLKYKLDFRLTNYIYTKNDSYNEKRYTTIDPRITIKYNTNDNYSFKLSYQNNHQFLHQTTISSLNLPTDFYLLSNVNAKPQGNHLFNLEYVTNLKNINITSDLYFNKVNNYSELLNGTINNLFTENIYDKLIFGNLISYGLEIGLNYKYKALSSSLNYTYSRSKIKFKEINNGQSINSIFDRPHNINTNINYNLNPKVKVGILFMFYSGQNYSEPTDLRIINEIPILNYNVKNNKRFPNYNRLDLSIDYNLKKTKRTTSKLNLTIYNVYNRKNPFVINYNIKTGGSNLFEVNKSTEYLFPVLPTINYTLTLN